MRAKMPESPWEFWVWSMVIAVVCVCACIYFPQELLGCRTVCVVYAVSRLEPALHKRQFQWGTAFAIRLELLAGIRGRLRGADLWCFGLCHIRFQSLE